MSQNPPPGSALIVTDGTTQVSPVKTFKFVGASVAKQADGVAQVTVEGGGGGGLTLTAATDLAAGTAVSINGSGELVQTWGPAPNVDGVVTLMSGPNPGFIHQSSNPYPLALLALSGSQFVAFSLGPSSSIPAASAVAFSLSGDAITVGSLKTDSSFFGFIAADALDASHFAYLYTDHGSGDVSVAVCSIAGNVITIGTPVDLTGGGGTESSDFPVGLVALSATSFVVTYADGSNNQTYQVCTVAGTTITAGSPNTTGLTGASAVTPFKLSATAVGLVWQTSGHINVDVGAISGTTMTLSGTPAVVTDTDQSTAYTAVALSATRFVVGVQNNLGQVLLGGTVTSGVPALGSPLFVCANPNQPPALIPMSGTEVVSYYAGNLPSIVTQSGTSLALTAGGAPVPLTGAFGSTTGPSVGSQPPLFSPLLWRNIVAVGGNIMFNDGEWNIYEGDLAGNVSPSVAHPGIINYAFAPIDGTRALAVLVDQNTNLLARVIHYETFNQSAPVGCVAAAVTAGNPASVTTGGACAGFTGLTPGAHYYSNGDGTVTTANTGHPIGVALAGGTQLAVAA